MIQLRNVKILCCLFLCIALAGCYFLEGGGTPRPTIERDLLADSHCLQRACWETWIPGETTIRDLENSGRFAEPMYFSSLDRIGLQGIGQDADIYATIDPRTGQLTRLRFSGPYPIDLQDVIDVLGEPEFVRADYDTTMSNDEPFFGTVQIKYPSRGYSFGFFTSAEMLQDSYSQTDTLEICFSGDLQVFDMRLYASDTLEDMLTIDTYNADERGMQAILSRYRQWTGYGCIQQSLR